MTTIPTVPDRPYRLRTVNGSRLKFVIRVDGRAVGHLWRTARDDRRAPWAWRIRMVRGSLVYDFAGHDDSRSVAEAELADTIRRIIDESGN